jgi:hypothetical protein
VKRWSAGREAQSNSSLATPGRWWPEKLKLCTLEVSHRARSSEPTRRSRVERRLRAQTSASLSHIKAMVYESCAVANRTPPLQQAHKRIHHTVWLCVFAGVLRRRWQQTIRPCARRQGENRTVKKADETQKQPLSRTRNRWWKHLSQTQRGERRPLAMVLCRSMLRDAHASRRDQRERKKTAAVCRLGLW